MRNDNGEAALAFYDKRRKWCELICSHPDLGHGAFRVGYWLSQRMNGEDQCCWYSVRQIAKRIGVSTQTVIYALHQLEAANVLIVSRTLGRRSSYSIRLPFEGL